MVVVGLREVGHSGGYVRWQETVTAAVVWCGGMAPLNHTARALLCRQWSSFSLCHGLDRVERWRTKLAVGRPAPTAAFRKNKSTHFVRVKGCKRWVGCIRYTHTFHVCLCLSFARSQRPEIRGHGDPLLSIVPPSPPSDKLALTTPTTPTL